MARLAAGTGGWAEGNRLGSGATGDVYRGELDGGVYAVKLLKLEPGASRAAVEELARRFAAELTTLASYRHARIVRLTHYAVAAGEASTKRPFALVFELLEEGSLADWLRSPTGAAPVKQGGLTALQRVDLALGVCSGLKFMHGVREAGEGAAAEVRHLHRDVKSSNVGLTRAGAAAAVSVGGGAAAAPNQAPLFSKLLDCGLSKAFGGGAALAGGGAALSEGVTFTGGVVRGTPAYMAPELISTDYGIPAEIYSLGVVLLELFTGARVKADSALTLREATALARTQGKRKEGPLTALADAGIWPAPALAPMASLILQCTDAERVNRPASVALVAAQLLAVRQALASHALVECAVCMEPVDRAACLQCHAGAHHTCHGCLPRVVEGFTTPDKLEQFGGHIPCSSAPQCKARPHAIEELAPHLEKACFAAYAGALRYHFADVARMRKEAEEALARAAAAALAAETRADRVRLLRLSVIDRHLLLRCPRCAAVFVDYNGCNALFCGQCACGFCAVCLADCKRDAHEHYQATHGRNYFDKPLFEATHRARRHAEVAAAVQALAGEREGRVLQGELLAAMAKDLTDLGIDVQRLRREVGV